MGVIEILLLGLALSADAFAVTISNSFAYAHEPRARLALMPVFFGAFQALMPLLGYFVGGLAARLIEQYSGVVTLVILGIIGGNMVREGVLALRAGSDGDPADDAAASADDADGDGKGPKHLTVGILVLQAIATAIDAFAVGVSLRAQTVNLPLAVCVIGLTTFACCVVALVAGRRLGSLLGDKAEIAGGLVLIGIGIKALLG
jgi:putative Mn2+ efflux pump MntP